MRGLRVKKLKAIYLAMSKKQNYPTSKGGFRWFKKLYMRGALDTFFPNM